MKNLLKALAVIVLISAVSGPVAAEGVDKKYYTAAGELAKDFCLAKPYSEEGLLGALVAGDLFNEVFNMSEQDKQNLAPEDLNRLGKEKEAERKADLNGAKYESCKNLGINVFDCYALYVKLAKAIAPKGATQKEKDMIMYDLTQTAEIFGATGYCGRLEMTYEIDGEKSSPEVMIYYLDGQWEYLLVRE